MAKTIATPVLDAVQDAIARHDGYDYLMVLRQDDQTLSLGYADRSDTVADRVRTTMVERDGEVKIYQSLYDTAAGADSEADHELRVSSEIEINGGSPQVMAWLNSQIILIKAYALVCDTMSANAVYQYKICPGLRFALSDDRVLSAHLTGRGTVGVVPGGYPTIEIANPQQLESWEGVAEEIKDRTVRHLLSGVEISEDNQQVALLAGHLTQVELPEGWEIRHVDEPRMMRPHVCVKHRDLFVVIERQDGNWTHKLGMPEADDYPQVDAQTLRDMGKILELIGTLPPKLTRQRVQADPEQESMELGVDLA